MSWIIRFVHGTRVLDIGAGSGLVRWPRPSRRRPCPGGGHKRIFLRRIALNAAANAQHIRPVTQEDIIEARAIGRLILVASFYERPLRERLLAWAAAGRAGMLGDPGRNYFPKIHVEKLATYRSNHTHLEDRRIRETGVIG